jgi:hypothetical protein
MDFLFRAMGVVVTLLSVWTYYGEKGFTLAVGPALFMFGSVEAIINAVEKRRA